jgi:DNA-binding NtrC family response regulator
VEGKSILVVDDDDLIRGFLTDFFVGLGYEVETADCGRDGLLKFEPQRYDLVISDLMMPDISGIEVLKGIMAQDPKTLFFLITGYPTVETAIEAIKGGAYDYVVKPFNLEDLKIKVERALLTRRLQGSVKRLTGIVWAIVVSVPIWIVLGIIIGYIWKRG